MISLLQRLRERRARARFHAIREKLGLPLLAFLEAARLRNVIDVEVLFREARTKLLDPGELLRQKSPARAVSGKLEVVRLAAAAQLIIAQRTGFGADALWLITRVCKDLEQKDEELGEAYLAAMRIAARSFGRVREGASAETVFAALSAEEAAAAMGLMLAFEFGEAWDAGSRNPKPSPDLLAMAEGLVLTPEKIERIWLAAASR